MTKKEKFKIILERLSLVIPNPKSELNYHSAFELLVAVILSAQTTDARVNMVTPELFKVASTPLQMANLGAEGILSYIRTVGLAGSKSRNLAATAALLHEKFNDEVPDTFEELISLPGVGAKTAKVVLNVWFNQPTIAVDTHIHRVANRLGLSKSQNPDTISEDLTKIVPSEFALKAHHYLLLHGRHVCKARTPLCQGCTLTDLCRSKDKIKQ